MIHAAILRCVVFDTSIEAVEGASSTRFLRLDDDDDNANEEISCISVP